MIEKRFEQIKSVHEIAPVFLKNEGRIEALFTLYFLALLVQALIEKYEIAALDEGHLAGNRGQRVEIATDASELEDPRIR